MAENQETKSRRDLFAERLKNRYPDKEFADDEAMFGQAGEDYDAYENELNGYREREGKMLDMFNNNPQSARFMSAMARGEEPTFILIEDLGPEGITDIINDPAKKAEYEEAMKRRRERIAREKELETEYNANFAETLATLKRVQEQRQLSDEVIDAAYDLLVKITNEIVMGKVSEETLGMALKALNYDADMTNARSEGEVAGRNAKIEEQIRKPQAGDGMPQIGGANAPAPAPKKRGFFDDLPKRKF